MLEAKEKESVSFRIARRLPGNRTVGLASSLCGLATPEDDRHY